MTSVIRCFNVRTPFPHHFSLQAIKFTPKSKVEVGYNVKYAVTAFIFLLKVCVTGVLRWRRLCSWSAGKWSAWGPHDNVTSTLKELHWLPIKQRVDYKLCLLLRKVTVRQASSYLTGMLTAVTDVPPRASQRVKRQLRRSQDPSEIRREGVFCCRPEHGTDCQQNSKLMRSTPVFKRSLKTFLFQTAYTVAGSGSRYMY